jgi:hypothetical protein
MNEDTIAQALAKAYPDEELLFQKLVKLLYGLVAIASIPKKPCLKL